MTDTSTEKQQQAPTEPVDESQEDTSQPDPAAEIKKLRAEAAKYRVQAKANADAAAKLASLEEAQKTEAQKLADRASAAEKEAADAKLEVLRLKVGNAKKLPADVIDLLKGDTEEELAAHADRLAEHFRASVRPSGSADQGMRGTGPASTPRDEFANFLKKSLGG
jgi:hypothetical protein